MSFDYVDYDACIIESKTESINSNNNDLKILNNDLDSCFPFDKFLGINQTYLKTFDRRINSLPYRYIVYKITQLMHNESELIMGIEATKLVLYDNVWKIICLDNDWKFMISISDF